MAVLWVNRSAWVVNAFLVLVDILLDVYVDRSAPLVLFVSFLFVPRRSCRKKGVHPSYIVHTWRRLSGGRGFPSPSPTPSRNDAGSDILDKRFCSNTRSPPVGQTVLGFDGFLQRRNVWVFVCPAGLVVGKLVVGNCCGKRKCSTCDHSARFVGTVRGF